jgi:hypothetical protein
MQRLLPWLFLLFPLMASADTTVTSIEITCQDERSCGAVPPYLPLQKLKKVIVKSSKEWWCFVYYPGAKTTPPTSGTDDCRTLTKDPGTAQHPALVFYRKDDGTVDDSTTKVVVPLLFEPAPASPATPKSSAGLLLPLFALVMGALTGMSLLLWLGTGAALQARRTTQERLGADVEPLQSTVSRITAALRFQDLPPRDLARGGEFRVSVGARPTAERHQIEPDRLQFMGRVDDWTKLTPTIPPEIRKQSAVLTAAGPGIHAADLQRIAETIAQVAVRSTDELAEPGDDSPGLQDALLKLVQAAGLSLIEPQPRDAFDDTRHRTTGTNLNAPSSQLRGRIAKVKRRGLERFGRVIAKAEVILYD